VIKNNERDQTLSVEIERGFCEGKYYKNEKWIFEKDKRFLGWFAKVINYFLVLVGGD